MDRTREVAVTPEGTSAFLSECTSRSAICKFPLFNRRMGETLCEYRFFSETHTQLFLRIISDCGWILSLHVQFEGRSFHKGLARNSSQTPSILLLNTEMSADVPLGYFTFANRLKQPNLLTIQCTSGSLFPFPLGLKRDSFTSHKPRDCQHKRHHKYIKRSSMRSKTKTRPQTELICLLL